MTTALASVGIAPAIDTATVPSAGTGPCTPPRPSPLRVSRTRTGSIVTNRPEEASGTAVK